ncbi:hypothetical protein HAX54_021182, partial [Datura stramonium]|nr:hypothetical protein [Datura stramonium]
IDIRFPADNGSKDKIVLFCALCVKIGKVIFIIKSEWTKESAKLKRQEIESVKKWRKQRQQSEFDKEGAAVQVTLIWLLMKMVQNAFKDRKRRGLSCLLETDQEERRYLVVGKGKGSEKKRKSREFRNSKFGFVGRKGLKKQNTGETTNDFRGFNKGVKYRLA